MVIEDPIDHGPCGLNGVFTNALSGVVFVFLTGVTLIFLASIFLPGLFRS